MYRKFGRRQKLSSPPPFVIYSLMWAANTSHAHIWGFHGNVHIAWGVYYIGIIILHLIPCTLQNIDESVPVCLELKLCQSHALVRLSRVKTAQ